MSERRIRRYENGAFVWEQAPLADEARVDIVVDGRRLASVMASPFQLECLALGFLFGEGLISGAGDVKNLSVRGLEVHVELGGAGAGAFKPRDIGAGPASKAPRLRLSAPEIIRLSEEFSAGSQLFRQTGAVHSCRLIDGERRYLADDVARHNALDKVIGQYLLAGPPSGRGFVLSTGRVSAEMLLKSAGAGLGAVISRGAATDRAVETAKSLNMLLIGFARQNRFNIYHGADMVEGAEAL